MNASSRASSPQQASFSGNGLDDVTEFLRDVQKVAFSAGRQRDDDWRADYVATCLSGPAMIFYMTLSDEDRYSWPKLCRSLLTEFSRPAPAPPEAPAAVPAAAPPRPPHAQAPAARPPRFEVPAHECHSAAC